MTFNNRSRKSPSNGDNPPGLVHANAFPISDNVDVGFNNRTRKSSCSENGVIWSSSGTAYEWLLQSGLASFAPCLSESR